MRYSTTGMHRENVTRSFLQIEQFNTEFNESIKEFQSRMGMQHIILTYDLPNDKLRKMIKSLKSSNIELKTYKEIVEDTKFRV